MSKSPATNALISLIKDTGPINTFYIGPKGAAYTQLKIINMSRFKVTTVELPTPKWQPGRSTKQVKLVKELPSQETITNEIIVQIPPIEESFRKQAIQHAKRKGRLECTFIGNPNTRGRFAAITGMNGIPAAQMIVQIAANANLRSKHRKTIAKALIKVRQFWKEKQASWPDPKQPDTLGWRVWRWDPIKKLLISPSQKTAWYASELRVKDWNTGSIVRGFAGIHAARMPYDWRRAVLDETELNGYSHHEYTIIGIVERLGRYVLGTEGWRTEWAIIRALRAPTTEIGLALEQAYPDVEIFYDNSQSTDRKITGITI